VLLLLLDPQVYTQPVFQLMEHRLCQVMCRPRPPLLGRLLLRVLYVLLITFVAILVSHTISKQNDNLLKLTEME
jgi:hypothetical protein